MKLFSSGLLFRTLCGHVTGALHHIRQAAVGATDICCCCLLLLLYEDVRHQYYRYFVVIFSCKK
jgi:hypothetical protein